MLNFSSKKILYVVNVDWFFISHRLPIAIKAIELGYEVHIASLDTGRRKYLESLGINFHDIPFRRGNGSILGEVKVLNRLRCLINTVRPDIIHGVTIKGVLYSGLVKHFSRGKAALVFAISGLGYVFTSDSLRAKVIRSVVVLLYKLSLSHRNKIVIFQNGRDEKIITSLASLRPTEKINIKGSGVDLGVYTHRVESQSDPVKVVMASRLLKEKGIYEFIEAAILLKGYKNIEFLLAGSLDRDNPSAIREEEVQRWVEDGLIVYLGARDDIPTVFENSHIVTLPSYYGEGVPKVLIEAAACGRPIVTTNNPGCRDAVIEGETGFIVPLRDSNALAKGILKLAEDQVLRKKMGAKARQFAELEFDVRSVVKKHLDIYKSLISN